MIVEPGATRPGSLHALRTATFVVEQGVDPAIERDDLDAAAWHSLVTDEQGSAVATGRLLDPGGDLAWGRVGRMAVVAAQRGRGRGLAVLRELEGVARGRGLVGIELHAQLHAAGFYARAGYDQVGEVYLEADIEHITMRRTWLPGLRPVADDDAAAVQQLIGGCWGEYGCVLDVDAEEPWMRRPGTSRPRVRMWVVPGPGRLDGCVAVDHDELKQVYVDAAARRRGLGEALVRLGMRTGARRLWSDALFTDAHRLYERLGWRRTGATRELGDLSDTTELELTLP